MLASSTVENYLKAIYLGVAALTPPERLMPMGQLASALGVAPGTATTMVKALAESGLVAYEPYTGVALTTSGEKLAALVLRRHRLVELFLVRVMGYAWDEVHDEAEHLEHVVSDRLIDRMDEMLGRPEVDPHGDPIPTADGLVKRQQADTLLTCPLQTPVVVLRVLDQDSVFLRFVERHRLKPGESIEVEQRDEAADAVRVRGRDNQQITIGTRAASKLLVRAIGVLLAVMGIAGPALAQYPNDAAADRVRPAADKSAYSLFHPTPRRLLREFAADRPDRTDTPFTVDAGHLQIEMDLANVTYDRTAAQGGHLRSTTDEVAPMNVKVGLRNNLDAQFVYTPYRIERTRTPGAPTIEQHAWFATVTPRLKVNLTGNDGGPFAIALIPFVSLPIGDDPERAVESGIGVPYSFDVPDWDLGLQSVIRVVRRSADGRTHLGTDHSISAGRKVVGRLSAYGELFARIGTADERAMVATTNTWLTYQLTDSWRLDGGVYIGITDHAEDWHPWIGMTWRN